MKKYFETSFGRKIEIVDGYYDSFPKKGSAKEILAEENSKPEKRSQLKYGGFLKDVYYYSLMIDMLEQHGIDLKVERALDVGGAEGSMARLLALEGRADYTHVIDLYDMRALLPDSLFDSHVRRLSRQSLLHKAGIRDMGKRELFEGHQRYMNKSSAFFNLRKKKPGRIAEYTLRDYYDVNSKYDLLTAFSCVDYFNPGKFFQKAGEIVNDGGIFYALLAYWWYPINCSLVVGDFPYASQRLSKGDFERYLKEFRPEAYEDTMERYNYFHLGEEHPVMEEYIEYADKAGFSVIDVQRLYGGKSKMSATTPADLNDTECKLAGIVEEINEFNPRVGLSDLYTFNLMVAFRKRPANEKPLSQVIRSPGK